MAQVFVVEDEEGIRTLIVETLQGKHSVVLQARNLLEALKALATIKELGVSVAIIDGAFPNFGDGASLAKILKEKVPEVKIISLSSNIQPWGDVNLQKPMGIFDLPAAVDLCLRK